MDWIQCMNLILTMLTISETILLQQKNKKEKRLHLNKIKM